MGALGLESGLKCCVVAFTPSEKLNNQSRIATLQRCNCRIVLPPWLLAVIQMYRRYCVEWVTSKYNAY